VDCAIDIIGESATAQLPQAAVDKRHNLALRILRADSGALNTLAMVLVAAATDGQFAAMVGTDTSADNSLKTVILGGWNKLAGVKASDLA
jgi:hypothetical protein